jgi:diguanylate cyclase (GGDEF)-like protein
MEMPQILLVEDELSIVKLMSEAIEKLGFSKPHVASTLAEAKKIARNSNPDIALIDIALGIHGDGQKAAHQLKEEFNFPVVFLSTEGNPDKKPGISSMIGQTIKPTDRKNLKKTIEFALNRRQQNERFSLLLTDLPLPSAVMGGEPLELLAWNKGFTSQFLSPEGSEVNRNHPIQKAALLSEVSKFSRQVIHEKKPVVVECKLSTNNGNKMYEITANRVDSVDKPVMLASFKEIPQMGAGMQSLMNSDSVFQNIFWNAPVMMMQMDQGGILNFVNDLWLQETGFSLDDVLQKPLNKFLDKSSARMIQQEILSTPNEVGTYPEMLLAIHTKNGLQKSFATKLSKSKGMENTPTIIGVLQESFENQPVEIDDESNLAAALRDTAAALTSTLNFDEVLDQILVNVGQVVPNEAANVMMIWSGVAYIVRSTGYAERGLEEAMMSLQLPINQEPHLLSMHVTGMPLAVKDTNEYAGLQHQTEPGWARSIASAPLKSKGQVFGFLNLESSQAGFYEQKHAERLQAFADQAAVAIENARLYAEVQQNAITDELTTIYNRRGLFELGKREVERAHRYGRCLSAIMIDCDKFKDINDKYTHSVGDQVLRILADRMKNCIREVDILGRYGGDEFAILLPETDLTNALPVAERLRMAVCGRAIETSAGYLPLSISVGVAEICADAITFEGLLEKADNAMFQAKAKGKNRVVS